MQFYKVIATLTDEKWEENNDRRVMQQRTRRIARKSNEFNQQQGGKSYYFISDIGNDEVIAGIIDSGTGDKTKQIRAFFKSVDIAANDFDIDESTFSSMRNLLSNADKGDYIGDDDEVLEKFELLEMNPEKVSESMLTSISEQDIEIPPARHTIQIQKIGFGA